MKRVTEQSANNIMNTVLFLLIITFGFMIGFPTFMQGFVNVIFVPIGMLMVLFLISVLINGQWKLFFKDVNDEADRIRGDK